MLMYVLLACAVLLFFRFFQGYMRNRREDKDFERTQDIVHERTKQNTDTNIMDARKKGSDRRLAFRRRGNRREDSDERRTSARRNEEEISEWKGENTRETQRRGFIRRLIEQRKSDRRDRERRKQ